VRRLVVLLVVLAGCGSEETRTPASVVPAESEAYVSLDPRLDGALERLLRAVGHDDANVVHDVRPWIGGRAAAFMVGEELGVAFEVRDEEGAAAFADEFQPAAVVGDHVVVSREAEVVDQVAAVEEDDGDVLAAIDGFDERGAVYATATNRTIAGGLANELGETTFLVSALIGVLPPDGRFTAHMTRDGRATRVVVTGLPRPPGEAPSLADLPGAAWLALSSADLGATLLTLFSIAPPGPPAYGRAQLASGLDLDDEVLRHLGAGTFFVQGSGHTDLGARLVVETKDDAALRRAAITLARELGPDAEVHTNRPGAGESWLELAAIAKGLDPTDVGTLDSFFAEIRSGMLDVDIGEATGGDSEQLRDMPYFQDAERRLGAPPTVFVDLKALSRFTEEPLPGAYFALAQTSRDLRAVYLR
jgi:hypothetical protein